jgi:hypothetical protein
MILPYVLDLLDIPAAMVNHLNNLKLDLKTLPLLVSKKILKGDFKRAYEQNMNAKRYGSC